MSAAEAARLDAAVAESWKLPPLVLMENAALRAWAALESRAGRAGFAGEAPIVALAGGGNNGGDALALLRQARFAGRVALAAVVAATRIGDLTALQLASLLAAGVPVWFWNSEAKDGLGDQAREAPIDRAAIKALLTSAGLIVDGLAGTGLRGELSGPPAELAALAAAAARPIAAIDVPSGLSDAARRHFPVLPARWTLSIEPRKTALYRPAFREAVGDIIAVEGVFPRDVSLHPQAVLLEAEDLSRFAPRPSPSAHKAERGRVALFAGSEGASGAAIIATRAASAAGAGLVCLYAPEPLYSRFAADASPLGAALVREEERFFSGSQPASALADTALADAVLAGPGWGFESRVQPAPSEHRVSLLARLLPIAPPLVLDAGALRLLSRLGPEAVKTARAGRPLVLTPHPGEFASLLGRSAAELLADPEPSLCEVSRAYGAVLVLKASVTWIADPEGRLAIYDGREPSLATAGSGDALAGVVTALLAAGLPPFEAACAAVIAHGCAGKAARAELGWYDAFALLKVLARLFEGATR